MRSSLASLALLLGAAAAILSAVITDVASGEHPTHTALLIASAGAVLALCWWRRTRAASARAAACSAVIVGPLLHLSAKRPPAPFPLDHGQPLHILGAEFPSAVMQIAIPAVVLLVITAFARLVRLAVGRICRIPADRPAYPSTTQPQHVSPRPRRHGSMLRWCGWAIRAARRGPPLLLVPVAIR